jgi:hypothetical protein
MDRRGSSDAGSDTSGHVLDVANTRVVSCSTIYCIMVVDMALYSYEPLDRPDMIIYPGTPGEDVPPAMTSP